MGRRQGEEVIARSGGGVICVGCGCGGGGSTLRKRYELVGITIVD